MCIYNMYIYIYYSISRTSYVDAYGLIQTGSISVSVASMIGIPTSFWRCACATFFWAQRTVAEGCVYLYRTPVFFYGFIWNE